ncbi:MAG: YlxM family DNA-binding protein [Thermoanaerobacterales bacterium]|nr:YlxM family DNA-binding protein [Thermoanaerobacterales bacterium]
MDNVTLFNLLYDCYGELLTEKQREIFELYYFHDLSLKEIAEHYDITRQGIHDIIRRAQYVLNKYENKLGMVSKLINMENRIQKVMADVKRLEPDIPVEQRKRLQSIYKDLAMILKQGGE